MLKRPAQTDEQAERLRSIRDKIDISVVLNFKGGVGKTTLAVNLAAYLANEAPVLLIDCDLQANATASLLRAIPEITLVDALRDQKTLDEAICKADLLDEAGKVLLARPNLWLIPSDRRMHMAAQYIAYDLRKLGRLLDEVLLSGGMLEDKESGSRVLPRYIILDTASLNPVTLTAILTAKDMLVPLELEFFSVQGIASLMQTVGEELTKLNHEVDLKALIPFNLQERRGMTKRYYRILQADETLGDCLYPPVHVDNSLAVAQENTLSIWEYRPKSRGAQELAVIAEYYTGKRDHSTYIEQLKNQMESDEGAPRTPGESIPVTKENA
jgi:chromosome partitioning protein